MAGELSGIIQEFSGRVEAAEVAALERINGEMKARIFQNGLASDGTPLDTFSTPALGRYSRGYGLKRQKAGRRTDAKDLEFHGDLRKSIAVGKTGQSNVIGFQYDAARLIAEGQEKQTRKKIWTPSDEEIDNAMEIYAKRLFG